MSMHLDSIPFVKTNNNTMSDSAPISNILLVVLAVFIFMKLAGVMPIAAWSWWMVFSPLWIGLGIFLFFVTIVSLVVIIYKLFF